MSGKAIIVLVTGVIIITATIMYNIEAASTRIVKNYSDYYMRQTTQNMAQSGVNMGYAQLGKNRAWRTGFTNVPVGDGRVTVKCYDTMFDSIPAIAIQSFAETDYNATQKRRDTSVAYYFFTTKQYPINVFGLLTLNSNAQANGSFTIDGRDHDFNGNLIPTTGVPAVWTTGSSFTLGSAATKAGGTNMLIDFPPTNPPVGAIIKLNQTPPAPGYPMTPDSVFGGEVNGYPEGTLKAIAKSGAGGSQYVTDPAKLKYPLSGVTYVEMPTTSPQNSWNSADISGTGLLVVHNKAGNAVLNNTSAVFKGLIISDDIMHLHGTILGGVIAMKPTLSGNVIGNGTGSLLYSREAIVEASKFLENQGRPNLIAWWE